MNVTIPDLYTQLLEPYENAAVEHSILNARAKESLLALALQDVSAHQDVSFFAPDLEWVKFQLSMWGVKAKTAYRSKNKILLKINGSILTVSDRVESNGIQYGVESQNLKGGCEFTFKSTFSGVFCERDHWFYKYARKADLLIRVNANSTLCKWSNEKINSLPESNPSFARLMDLEDVIPTGCRAPRRDKEVLFKLGL